MQVSVKVQDNGVGETPAQVEAGADGWRAEAMLIALDFESHGFRMHMVRIALDVKAILTPPCIFH